MQGLKYTSDSAAELMARPFKGAKVVKLMSIKMVPYVKEKELILDISLNICIPFLILRQLIVNSVITTFVVFQHDTLTHFVNEWSPYTFLNILDSNHTIELINTGTVTCYSTPDK